MALTDPKNTLAYHGSRVLTTHRDMSKVPCASVAAKMKSFMSVDVKKDTQPETEALWFYGMNHGVALIAHTRAPLEPLDAWEHNFLTSYHARMADKAVRAFYYLIWICTREARHNQSLSKDLPQIQAQFGDPVFQFMTGLKGGEAGISTKFLNQPPDTSIGVYCDALRWTFYNSKWSNGYGGKAWGQVTDCLCRFVSGEFTAEMMLDTVWTLCHNNGPIFNKGEFYTHYESAHAVKRILDVQRSGQIPEMVLANDGVGSWTEPDMVATMQTLYDRFPKKIGTYVDWMRVEALGSVQKYPNEIAAQKKKYGMTPEQKAAIAKAEAEAAALEKAKAEAAAKKAAEHAKNFFEVMPGVEVPKVYRKHAA